MNLADVRWIDIRHADDDRGTLTVFEGREIPFEVRRIFYMHRVPPDGERGEHAHLHTQQVAIAVNGAFAIDVFDGASSATFVLDDPNRGLYLPAMTWVRIHAFQPATVALVLCDTIYNPAHVVRNWDEYCRLRQEPPVIA